MVKKIVGLVKSGKKAIVEEIVTLDNKEEVVAITQELIVIITNKR